MDGRKLSTGKLILIIIILSNTDLLAIYKEVRQINSFPLYDKLLGENYYLLSVFFRGGGMAQTKISDFQINLYGPEKQCIQI